MKTEITRRDMLGATAAATALVASNWIFAFDDHGNIIKAATKNGVWIPDFFSKKEISQIEALCEGIIPKTDTAGASEARVHEYVDLLYSMDSPDNQAKTRAALKWTDKHCKKTTKSSIAKASPEQIEALLETLSDAHDSHPEEYQIGVELFRELKEKAIRGYYTSKEGRVQELGLPEHTMMTTFNGCTHIGDDH